MREKGVVHLLVPIILAVGLLVGLYLVQNTQIFKPKAYGGPISGSVNICKSNLTYFSVSDSCDEVQNGFRSAYFSCQGRSERSKVAPDEGSSGGDGGPTPVCKTINDWVKRAVDGCASICKNPSPSSTSTESKCWINGGRNQLNADEWCFGNHPGARTAHCNQFLGYNMNPDGCSVMGDDAIRPSDRCNVHDGDVSSCDADPGCAYYACSNRCFLRGTSNDIACATSSGQ